MHITSTPKGFHWKEFEGLTWDRGRRSLIVANAYPILRQIRKVCDMETGKEFIELDILLHYWDGTESEVIKITESELKRGRFLDLFPLKFAVRPEVDTHAAAVFRLLIKAQVADVNVEEIRKLRFGWNGFQFFWGDDEAGTTNIPVSSAYAVTLELLTLLCDIKSITGYVLAAVHGPLKSLLEAAGIAHDFVTLVVGASSHGKTDMARAFCVYTEESQQFFSLGSSDSRGLRRFLKELWDVSAVVDDLNGSKIKGLRDKNMRLASELIYGASDTGVVVLNNTRIDTPGCTPHLVLTAEKTIHTESTMNRCFLMCVEEEIDERTWSRVEDFLKEKKMHVFMRSFTLWLQEHYEDIVRSMEADYMFYLRKAKDNLTTMVPGTFRIRKTIAIQLALWRCILSYANSLNIDQKLLAKANTLAQNYMWDCGEDLISKVFYMQTKNVYRKHLCTLADMLIQTGACAAKYYIAASEEKYLKRGLEPHKGQYCLGVCLVDGYLSYRAGWMCQLIAMEERVDSVSETALGKELKYHGLAHLDDQGKKVSSHWHSEVKMHHVRVRELLELIHPDDIYSSLVSEVLNNFSFQYEE